MTRKKNYTNKDLKQQKIEMRHFRYWQQRNALLRSLYSRNESLSSELHKDYIKKIKTGQPIEYKKFDEIDSKVRILQMVMDEYDQTYYWMDQIPPLNFKSEWDVTVLPGFAGAFSRFRVNDFISVYLDVHDRLGFMNRPYWELYDGNETQRFLLEDVIGLMAAVEELIDGSTKENENNGI